MNSTPDPVTLSPAQEPGGLPVPARIFFGLVLAVPLAGVALVALSLTGWGFETDPSAQLLRDLPQLAVVAVAGALGGAAVAWAFFGARRGAVWAGACVGVVPAVLRASANFTSSF